MIIEAVKDKIWFNLDSVTKIEKRFVSGVSASFDIHLSDGQSVSINNKKDVELFEELLKKWD